MTVKPTRRASKRASASDRQKTVRKRRAVKANALYEELFASAPDGILLVDPETQRVIEFNDAACRLLGYTREEFGGLRLSDFEASETAEETRAHVRTALREGKTEFDTLSRTKTGEIRHMHVWAKTCDLHGRTAFYGIVRDITERRQAEDALRRSAQFLAQSQRIAHLGNWMLDLETAKVTWSDELYRIYGVPPGALLTLDAFLSLIHPDDLSAMRSWMNSALSENKPGPIEFRAVRPDGTIRVIEGDGEVHVNAEHKPIRMIGTAQDITERKQAEQTLRRSLDLLDQTGQVAKVGGWELDLDTQTLRWTKEVYRIHEVDPAVHPSVAKAIEFYAPEARPVITAAVQAAIDAGTPFDLELPLVTAQGRRIWVRAQGTAERRGDKTMRLYGAFQDITERLQLEAQYRQAQKMESVGQLASGIAHDFNNLLTVINGMSDLVLLRVSKDNPVRADVHEILRAGERAATLTRQLLAFSRQQILEPRVMNFNTVVAGMESLLRRLLGEDIDLVVVPTEDLDHVKADPGQIEQVITNLAVNARDAMPEGGQLTIETENVTIDEDYARRHGVAVPPGSYVLLAVSDSGVGMDEATRARIFEPFFTTKGPGKGTGLGLSMVYGIVKQSHGFIWVDSEVGQGTSFKICLPQVTEATAPGPSGADRGVQFRHRNPPPRGR